MNNQAFNALEFGKLRQIAERFAGTPMGRENILSLAPFTERDALDNSLKALDECVKLYETGAKWQFQDISDPSESLGILRIANAALPPLAILDLANLIEQVLSARLIILSEKENAPTLFSIVESVPRELARLVRKLQEKILPGGILDDRASPELARIRSDIQRQRERIARSLETLMQKLDAAVQDEFITVRNDRFVIPVKNDFRGRIQGVSHGFSSSGQTVFLEPLQTIEANNELQSLREAEEREIARILYEMTNSLRYESEGIELAVRAITELDVINAKAAFLRAFKCVVPSISADETLSLIEARHPILLENLKAQSQDSNSANNTDEAFSKANAENGAGENDSRRKDVVPLTFSLSAARPAMIISGANAGGKTVVLKTAGLLSLMALSGLPVPAKDAQVPFYQSILADIGDHQSLAANLSTFTSHVSNIARMMNVCESPALVLLDEVGTGTDPEEGSALGVAVVDYFRRYCGAHVVASTHYRGLKMYAANNEDVQNASVEFDEKTLQPTYKLLVGIPGASSGLEIARRFGLPEKVMEMARQNVERASIEADDFLLNLKREIVQAQDLRAAVEDERKATAERYAQLELDYARRERERSREFEKKINETVEAFEKQSKALLENIEDKTVRAKMEREAQARRAELKRAAFSQTENVKRETGTENKSAKSDAPQVSDSKPQVGSRVLLKNFGSVGTIEKIEGETAEVLVGSMRLREKMANLQTVVAEQTKEKSRAERLQTREKSIDKNLTFDEEDMNAELNIIGKTTADAEDLLDKFLDNSFLTGFRRIRIVHGIGTGALKNFVHQHLKGHPHVERFTLANQSEGGNGATIVEMKQ